MIRCSEFQITFHFTLEIYSRPALVQHKIFSPSGTIPHCQLLKRDSSGEKSCEKLQPNERPRLKNASVKMGHKSWKMYSFPSGKMRSELLYILLEVIRTSIITLDYTTIQRMTIPRLTKWRPYFDILMIQQLFFLKKKAKFFFLPLTGFT